MKKLSYPYDAEYRLCLMLDQAQAAIFSAREKELAKYGISPMKALVLFAVKNIGSEATPAEIARWILRKSHTVSGLLERMEKDGLITKNKSLPKKNMVRVTITPKGQKALTQAMKRVYIRRIIASIPEEDREQLFSRLKRLRDKGLKLSSIPTPPYPKTLNK